MPEWMQLALAVSFVLPVAIGLILFFWSCWCRIKRCKQDRFVNVSKARVGPDQHHCGLHAGVVKLHQACGGQPRPQLFSWADHPSLVMQAIENAWSGFVFAAYAMDHTSPRGALQGLCGAGDTTRDMEPNISWEVRQDSSNFVQKVRLNPGMTMTNSASTTGNNGNRQPLSALLVIKTVLPLPGPPLGNSSFPQEAYFEIMIISCTNHPDSISQMKDGETTKLIQDNLRSNSVHIERTDESKLNLTHDQKSELVAASVGLTAGGALPLKLPGSFPGSIGFHSTGSVYLDGIKLAFESEKAEWGTGMNKVIGCGFDPRQKKVFFTVGSDLIHVIYCKPEEFGAPLYPTLAANSDITVLVNFGQCPFLYSPANAHRKSNPRFIGPAVKPSAAALGYSSQQFSMGRIDSQCLSSSMNNNRNVEFDNESEADLFEISLDGNN